MITLTPELGVNKDNLDLGQNTWKSGPKYSEVAWRQLHSSTEPPGGSADTTSLEAESITHDVEILHYAVSDRKITPCS